MAYFQCAISSYAELHFNFPTTRYVMLFTDCSQRSERIWETHVPTTTKAKL